MSANFRQSPLFRTVLFFVCLLCIGVLLITLGRRNDAITEAQYRQAGVLTADEVSISARGVSATLNHRLVQESEMVKAGQVLLELDAEDYKIALERLNAEYAQQESTIAAYREHGAIVHYEPTPETDVPLRPEGFLLLDSGAQYLDGTTDITRTVALGPVTDEQRLVYTLVLKGHIGLELCRFPRGASGTQLDAIARKDMWRYGLNYLHGTGHGVGSYLNVHEGPHQIRMEYKPAPLVEGMTVTDEPGIYLPGLFGVRTENTLLIAPWKETQFGRFLQFEPLTLCPIDTEPIILDMLAAEERDWLNAYHKTVYDRLSPHLDGEDLAWLAAACAPV